MSASPAPRRSWVEQIMGMPVSMLARGERAHGTDAARAVATVFAELSAVDALFSPYREDSAVSRVARGEVEVGACGPQVRDVFARCEHYRELTGGLFDAVRPDGRWDPSGLVKGWAVERAARHLGAVGGVDWCLNAGGDVVVVCPSGAPFNVGIADPHDESRVATVVACRAGAVATSGTAARGAHLYDPRSGQACAELSSVTVVGPSLETADVLATAAFVAGQDGLDLVAAAAGYEAMCIELDGRQSVTAGWTAGDGTLSG